MAEDWVGDSEGALEDSVGDSDGISEAAEGDTDGTAEGADEAVGDTDGVPEGSEIPPTIKIGLSGFTISRNSCNRPTTIASSKFARN